MYKIVKRIAATALAAILAMGAVSAVGSADAVEKDYWETYHTRQTETGTYTGKKDTCFLLYTTNGYNVYCEGLKTSTSGGGGYVTVRCTTTNATMSSFNMDKLKKYFCQPKLDGGTSGLTFEFSAYSNLLSATLTGNGSIEMIW